MFSVLLSATKTTASFVISLATVPKAVFYECPFKCLCAILVCFEPEVGLFMPVFLMPEESFTLPPDTIFNELIFESFLI